MSLSSVRTALTRAPQARSYSAGAGASVLNHGGGENAVKTRKMWRALSIAGIPLVIICSVYNYLVHKEHEKHFVRPEFKPYSYLAIRKKKFPWGDGNHTLFHNPHNNALPDGYET